MKSHNHSQRDTKSLFTKTGTFRPKRVCSKGCDFSEFITTLPKHKSILHKEVSSESPFQNVNLMKGDGRAFFVSKPEHLGLKRPVTRYDFKAITHNKKNGLPKFVRRNGVLKLARECKLINVVKCLADGQNLNQKSPEICKNCYKLYNEYCKFSNTRNRYFSP